MRMCSKQFLQYLILAIIAVVPIPAYSAGLPGEFQSTSWWRALHSEHSAAINPAFLTEEDFISVRAVQALLQGTEFSLTEVGITVPIGWTQSVGFSVVSQNSGPIHTYIWQNENSDDPIYASTGTTNFGINDFLVSYATNPLSRLSLGGNAHLLYMNLFGEKTEFNFQLDAGASWRVMLHPVLGRHLIGFSISNILPGSSDKRMVSSTARVSYIGNILDERIEIGIHASAKDFLYSKEQYPSENFFREWEINPQLTWYFLGYFKVALIGGYNDAGPSFAAPSIGVNFPPINGGRDLEARYQFTYSLTEDVAPSHSIYIRADLGQSRGDRFAAERVVTATLEPSRLYNLGRKLYSEGKYWDAYFVLCRIPVEYPHFFKNDMVLLLQASSLEELDMRDAAESHYGAVRENYKGSPAVPFAYLGEMRLRYRDNDDDGIVGKYTELVKSGASDSLKCHGEYLLGEMYLKQGNYKEATARFADIPPKHPDYTFALYSRAIAEILNNNDMQKAIEYLSVCVSVDPSTKSQFQIKDRAMLSLGFIFYEQNSMANAVVALREIHPQSLYYEDALLGLTWVALKSGRWDDCIEAGTTLRKVTHNLVVSIEAGLTEAYAYIMKKEYARAVAILSKASENMGEISSEKQLQELVDRKDAYSSDRLDYDDIAKTMIPVSVSRQSETVLRIIDSLGQKQKRTKRKIDSFFSFKFGFDKTSLFMKNYEQLRKDVDFALAKAESLAQKYKQEKDIIKARREEQAIDDEIIKLRRELDDNKTDKNTAPAEQ